jgi:hypothetical protein
MIIKSRGWRVALVNQSQGAGARRESSMSAEAVKRLIMDLSRSQGFYGRLLASIESYADGAYDIYARIGEGCKDDIDVIMKLEGC